MITHAHSWPNQSTRFEKKHIALPAGHRSTKTWPMFKQFLHAGWSTGSWNTTTGKTPNLIKQPLWFPILVIKGLVGHLKCLHAVEGMGWNGYVSRCHEHYFFTYMGTMHLQKKDGKKQLRWFIMVLIYIYIDIHIIYIHIYIYIYIYICIFHIFRYVPMASYVFPSFPCHSIRAARNPARSSHSSAQQRLTHPAGTRDVKTTVQVWPLIVPLTSKFTYIIYG